MALVTALAFHGDPYVTPIYTPVRANTGLRTLRRLIIEAVGYPEEDSIFAFPRTPTGVEILVYFSVQLARFFRIEGDDKDPPPPKKTRLVVGPRVRLSQLRRLLR